MPRLLFRVKPDPDVVDLSQQRAARAQPGPGVHPSIVIHPALYLDHPPVGPLPGVPGARGQQLDDRNPVFGQPGSGPVERLDAPGSDLLSTDMHYGSGRRESQHGRRAIDEHRPANGVESPQILDRRHDPDDVHPVIVTCPANT